MSRLQKLLTMLVSAWTLVSARSLTWLFSICMSMRARLTSSLSSSLRQPRRLAFALISQVQALFAHLKTRAVLRSSFSSDRRSQRCFKFFNRSCSLACSVLSDNPSTLASASWLSKSMLLAVAAICNKSGLQLDQRSNANLLSSRGDRPLCLTAAGAAADKTEEGPEQTHCSRPDDT